jgi:hypothetical protein
VAALRPGPLHPFDCRSGQTPPATNQQSPRRVGGCGRILASGPPRPPVGRFPSAPAPPIALRPAIARLLEWTGCAGLTAVAVLVGKPTGRGSSVAAAAPHLPPCAGLWPVPRPPSELPGRCAPGRMESRQSRAGSSSPRSQSAAMARSHPAAPPPDRSASGQQPRQVGGPRKEARPSAARSAPNLGAPHPRRFLLWPTERIPTGRKVLLASLRSTLPPSGSGSWAKREKRRFCGTERMEGTESSRKSAGRVRIAQTNADPIFPL